MSIEHISKTTLEHISETTLEEAILFGKLGLCFIIRDGKIKGFTK